MKFHQLKVKASKPSKRVGRGISAGRGKTAGRGTKGQGSRAGSSKRPGFEGGQNPLMQRLPKLPGFRSKRSKAEAVYTGQLDQFGGKTVDATVLSESGLISSPHVRTKLLYKGEVTKKVTVKLPEASQRAIEALQKAGGTYEKVSRIARTKQDKSKARHKKA